jgi:hypothetical protein
MASAATVKARAEPETKAAHFAKRENREADDMVSSFQVERKTHSTNDTLVSRTRRSI